MATQSPFLLLEHLARSLAERVAPPVWAIDEAQRRIVLLLNHVLLQESAATGRLARQGGRIVLVQWQSLCMCLRITPAGLFELAPPDATADLSLTATDSSAATIAQSLLRGEKPTLRIEGDVQLAADVNWLVDHVRWDIEDDLARIIGDAPAHAVGQFVQRAAMLLRQFVPAGAPSGDPGGAAP